MLKSPGMWASSARPRAGPVSHFPPLLVAGSQVITAVVSYFTYVPSTEYCVVKKVSVHQAPTKVAKSVLSSVHAQHRNVGKTQWNSVITRPRAIHVADELVEHLVQGLTHDQQLENEQATTPLVQTIKKKRTQWKNECFDLEERAFIEQEAKSGGGMQFKRPAC